MPTLDVREIDGPPFDSIMAALDDLSEGATLLLVAPFEPEPLYEVLATRGFIHETERVEPDRFHVHIEHA